MSAAVRMLYFAWVREKMGVGEEDVAPPDHVSSVADLVEWLATAEPHATAFADRARLRAAVDGVFVPFDASIRAAGEVAIFPPVTGG